MTLVSSDEKKQAQDRLETLFRLARTKIRDEIASSPEIQNGFAGLLLSDGSCLVWASRDFDFVSLQALATAVQAPSDTIVVFPERIMEHMPERYSRWVINGVQPAIISKAQVLEHTVCVIKRAAVAFIGWSPNDEAALRLPRTCAEAAIYGS